MRKPNFFLIGAPKCGTTAVAKALGRHPQVFMSEPKEPSYFLFTQDNPYGFDKTTRVSSIDDYLRLFAGANDKKVFGEASPLYIYAPYVAAEIHSYNSHAKIMAILRNPVERACSMYLASHQYDRRYQVNAEDFRQKFLQGTLTHIPVEKAVKPMEFLKSFGFYHQLLEPYYKTFPREQILIAAYNDLKTNSATFARRALTFLEVDDSCLAPIPQENVTFQPKNRELYYWLNLATKSAPRQLVKKFVASREIAVTIRNAINRVNQRKVNVREFLSDELHRELIETYRADIARLSDLVGRDFNPWLDRACL